jgi:hypothetical protein
MILRRIIGHFRQQEWTAIAIDFVIVVLGVVIGIQVSHWNDDSANAVLAVLGDTPQAATINVDLKRTLGDYYRRTSYGRQWDVLLRAEALAQRIKTEIGES